MMDNRYEIADTHGMTHDFADWFFDTKKEGCGNVWFMMMHAMWEGWKGCKESVVLDIDWPEANDDTWMEGEDGAYARGHEDGKDKVVIAVRQAIRAAGIKVKE
ncbi:TPA: hypothetical protein ONC52_001966 [Enterobacter asburiae]|nr:hypothetical protein [Enterobacter asburiae]HCR2223691.1 hypothetical protein [Enterobacter asburiae]